VSANRARIRINTTAPNSSEKPSTLTSKGVRKAASMELRPIVMLGGWCSEFHHTTLRLMIGILTAPSRPKMAGIRALTPSRSAAWASAI
jgi:hypothetical protein